MALALAQDKTNDGYQARLDDLRLVAAASRLAAVGLDGNSTDYAIADALAKATDSNGYAQLLSHRQNLLQNPGFVDAMSTLSYYGFDRNSTSAQVIDTLQTQNIEQAKAVNAQLVLTQDADRSLQLQLQTVLNQLGVLPDDWTQADGLPDPTDPVVTNLDPDSQDAATTALNLLAASYRLTNVALSGTSIDDQIETTLAGDAAAIAQAKADRDSLSGIVESVGEELELNKRTLEQYGLASDGSLSDAEITDQITSASQPTVDAVTDALDTISQNAALLSDYDALAALGLTANSDDTSFALPFVDADQFQSLQSDRDRLQNTDLVLLEANDRLIQLGVDLTSPDSVTDSDLALAFINVDLLGSLGEAQQTLANSADVDFASSADQAVRDANSLLTSLGLTFARGSATLEFTPTNVDPANSFSIGHDASFGSLTLAIGPANQQEQLVIPFNASANELEAGLESLTALSDVSVTRLNDGTGWIVTLNDPIAISPSDVHIVANHLLAGQAGNADVAAAALAADPATADSGVIAAANSMQLRGLNTDSSPDQLDTATQFESTFAAMQAAGQTLANYNQHRFISLSYENSQLFIGFDFSLSGSTPPIDLGRLDTFLHKQIGLPDDITVDIGGELALGGSLSTSFKLGVDLGSLQNGITADELFVELDNLTFTGSLETNDLDLTLGYGPLTGSIKDALIDLNAGLQFRFDNDGKTIATIADLQDKGFSILDVSPSASSLDADLPVELGLNGVTAASTELKFHSNDLFGDLSDLISQLPSLNDIAHLSIDQIMAGIRKAVDFIENEALAHPQTVAEMPLVNEYLDTALSDIRAGLDFVQNLESAQSQQLWHNAAAGKIELRFAGEQDSFTLDFGTINSPLTVSASDLAQAIDGLSFTTHQGLSANVTGDGTAESPWTIRFTGGSTSVDVPNLEIVGEPSSLIDQLGNPATFTIVEPDAQLLSTDAASGVLTLGLEGDADTLTLNFGDDNAPHMVTSGDLRDAIASLDAINNLDVTVEVTGDGDDLAPWQIRYAVYELQSNGVAGQIEFQLGDSATDRFSFDLDANGPMTAAQLTSAIGSLPSVSSQQLTASVSGEGTSGAPWMIQLTDANGSRVPVAEISVVSNTSTTAAGTPATVTFSTLYDSSSVPDLRIVSNSTNSSDGAAGNVTIHSPTANNVAKQLTVAERFLERALGVDESQFVRIWQDGVNGTATLAVDGNDDTLSIAYDMTTVDFASALQTWDAFNPGAVATVTVSGNGTYDDPWIVRVLDASGSRQNAPSLVVQSNNFVSDVGNTATLSIEMDRDEHVDLLLDGTSVLIDLGKNFSFSDPNFAFTFDLSHLADQLDDNNPFKDALDQVGNLAQIAAGGVVDVAVDGRIDFTVGFDPNELLGDSIFITDDSTLTMNVLLDAEDLTLDLALNVDEALQELPQELQNILGTLLKGTSIDTVGIHVVGGSVTINNGVDDSNPSQLLPASFNFSFSPDDTTDPNDPDAGNGRYSVFSDQLSSKLVTQHAGDLLVDLPLYFPTQTLPMGGTTDDRDGNGIPDNHLQVEVTDFNAVRDSLSVSTPHFKNSISLFSLLDNIDIATAIAGKGGPDEDLSDPFQAGLLGTLEDILQGDIFGIHLPFIGDSLKDGANFIETFRDSLRSELDSLASECSAPDSPVTTIDVVSGALYLVFKNLGVSSCRDIIVTGNTDHVVWEVDIKGRLITEGVDLDFAGAVPGLGLDIDGQVDLTVDYGYSLGFGLSISDGLYIDAAKPSELEVVVTVALAGSNADAFHADATLGFVTITLDDNGIQDLNGNDSGSGIFGTFYIDLKDGGDGDGRLSISELGGSNIIDANLEGKAEANFHTSLGIADVAALPKLDTDFYFLQQFGVGAGRRPTRNPDS